MKATFCSPSRRTHLYLHPIVLLIVLALWAPHLVKLVQCKPPDPQEKPQQQQQTVAFQQDQSRPNVSKNKQNERINLIESDENNLYLVGLFDVHHSNPRVPFKCGSIDTDAGEWQSRRPMQNMEAFLWAIEQVNADKSLLPGVQLGSLVMDTCSSFLRTNQQMANLLHGHQQNHMLQTPNPRQIAAIVADNADAHSVEAVTSMASALGITTFVTQSRSTSLSELARRYRSSQPMLDDLLLSGSGSVASLAGAKLLNPSDLVVELERRSSLSASNAAGQQQFESLLGELLGIGKMTSTPLPSLDGNQALAINKSSLTDDASDTTTTTTTTNQAMEDQKLLMVRMLLGNELLADSIAAFVQQMNWDFVSLIYDDEFDMIDLHDELARKLFARNTQLALDEQVNLGSSTEIYDKLLQSLAKKSALGAKVVITLLGTGSSRALLDSLRHLRRSSSVASDQVNQVNSLLWVTVTDREPYYAFATDALGTIAITSSVSLLPDFKSHYDRLENKAERPRNGNLRASSNKWWPEYVKLILQRHQKDIELVSNECSKWQEPKVSPLNERCRALTLQQLVQAEKQLAMSGSSDSAAANKSRLSSPLPAARLSKYLAGGWEHNGMDVINSVLAIANGLESIRQALCPESQSGLCDRMRELIDGNGGVQSTSLSLSSPSSSGASGSHQSDQAATTTSGGQQQQQQQQQFPLISELMYNELLRSTFQLADGRMFNLDDLDAQTGGGQVEGKLKLYNLRYLQANSIGFVKFGTYDQQDGLLLNASKAMYYPNNTYLHQVPIERLKSSCLDETKCLMLASYEYSMMNKQAISEEELALGVNSLFKLDHPMITSSSSSSSSSSNSAISFNGSHSNESLLNQQVAGLAKTGKRQTTIEDSHVHTMRSPFAILSHFNQTTPATRQVNQLEGRQHTTFNTIVLLPLHRKQHQSSSSSSSSFSPQAPGSPGRLGELEAACSEQLDIKHSFQYLVALAYAQNLANTKHNPSSTATSATSATTTATTSATNAVGGAKIELTTTVIDYCEQLEWAKTKLAAKLSSERQQQQQQLEDGNREQQVVERFSGGKQVAAVIDFDTQIGEHISDLTTDQQLLHLTISGPSGLSQAAHFNGRRAVTTTAGKQQRGAGRRQQQHHKGRQVSGANEQANDVDDGDGDGDGGGGGGRGGNQLRLNLLPTKSNEIQAIVKLISSMSQWKLVHLIYTDHHHYRDEFVRRANEAGICVSKLIWIPSPDRAVDPLSTVAADANDSLNTKESQQLDVQVEKTKRLFARELHDYSNPTATATATTSASPEGLNSTRILVVLASSSDLTNQLILEAASQSMLDDYVWLTSHEWLSSVEMAAERSELRQNVNSADDDNQQPRLPRNFISTRLETFESASFRNYFTSLSPAIHAPIPTDWFDEFWQQQFQCRLPIVGSAAPTGRLAATWPLCKAHQHLDLNQIVEDDRVHYIIMAIQAIHEALHTSVASNNNNNNSSALLDKRKFSNNFRSSFKRLTSKTGAGGDPLAKLPVGFHFVHRVLPSSQVVFGDDKRRRQRQNSRDLAAARAPGQLLKVGMWRDGQLVLMRKPTNESSNLFHRLNRLNFSDDSTASDDDDEVTLKVAASLARLGAIRSRCSLASTCNLCRQQVEQTKAAIKLEEARYGQSQQVDEPNAISSIWASLQPSASSKQSSILDAISRPTLESADRNEDDEDEDEGVEDDSNNRNVNERYSADNPNKLLEQETSSLIERRRQKDGDVEASASSLFDANTKRQVDEQRQADVRQAYSRQTGNNTARWSAVASQSMVSTSFRQGSGIAMSVLSLLGIVCMVASMTHLYPRMLERKEGQLQSESHLLQYEPKDCSSSERCSATGNLVANQPTLANINDYFLLTGLLMLCSINMAFLLPATKSVCWFRRIGLATSYTVIFSSILVKVLASCRRSSSSPGKARRQSHQSSNSRPPLQVTKGLQQSFVDQHQQQQQVAVVDPVDENVELTFESLPPDQGIINNQQEPNQQTSGPTTVSEQLSNAYQTQSASTNEQLGAICKQSNSSTLSPYDSSGQTFSSNSNLMTVSMGLILMQLLVSLTWLIQLPPEPTLYFACWRCSSPTRSPNLFLYEPLLSLTYPALVLLVAWIWAVAAFKRASRNEVHHRLAAGANAHPKVAGINYNNDNLQISSAASGDNSLRQVQLNKERQYELDDKLRDSKSLVMTTTLLILIWSLFTLNMISTSQRQLLLPSTGISASTNTQQNSNAVYSISRFESANKLLDGDLTLVYANLISGAIIFSFLFVYRLHLFSYISFTICTCKPTFNCLKFKRSKQSRNLIYAGSSDNLHSTYGSHHRGVLKFNQASSTTSFKGDQSGDKWLTDCDDDIYPVTRRFTADGSLFSGPTESPSNAANERLRLHQFNSYGTTSSGAASIISGDHHNRTSSSSSTMKPLSSFQAVITNSFKNVTTTSGGSKRTRGLIGTGKQEAITTTTTTTTSCQPTEEEDEVKYRAALEKATRRQRSRAHSILFFGSSLNGGSSGNTGYHSAISNNNSSSKQKSNDPQQRKRLAESKLQRRQSAGSVASSSAKLVPGSDNNSINDDTLMDDTISCASSVASSSTSQLHGNDLYPIDCSIQLDLQLPSSIVNETNTSSSQQPPGTIKSFGRPERFERRSLRRSINAHSNNKELSSVLEEQVADSGEDNKKVMDAMG